MDLCFLSFACFYCKLHAEDAGFAYFAFEEIQKNDEIRFMDKTRKVESYLLSSKETETYTILTKNNNFYADGVLVHSEIGE
mgnify:CR=1 FL=1